MKPRASHRRRTSPAFTLLEAIIAMVILSGACVVLLQMRTQAIDTAQRMQRQQQLDRANEALFQSLIAGLLGKQTIDSDSGLPVWTGDHLGHSYRIAREKVVIDNPVAGQVDYPVDPEVWVWKYTLTYRGSTSTFYWHR